MSLIMKSFDALKECVRIWNKYWGAGWALIPFLVGAAFLLVFRRKDKEVKNLLLTAVSGVFVFFFPLAAKLMWKFIGRDVYWRVLWIVPVIPLTACAAVHAMRGVGTRNLRFIIIIITVIVLTGKDFRSAYVRVNNSRQVPDTVAAAVDLINEDRAGKDVMVAGDDFLASYIRVYDPDIRMPYGRAMRYVISIPGIGIYQGLQKAPDCNYARLAKYASREDCDYLLVCKITPEGEDWLKKINYEKIGEAGNYAVMKRING